jgi:preflagellin peptidase FlaK
MILPLALSSAAVGVTLLYASVLDIRERRVPFRTWYPMLAVTLPLVLWFYGMVLIADGWQPAVYFLAMTGIFSFIFYFFAYFRFFGGADAWALIFICISIPTFPFMPLSGYPPHNFFPFSVLVNAVILNLLTPAGIYVMNVVKGNRAPFPYKFLGFPVDGDKIGRSFGYVMEEIDDDEGRLNRRFIRTGEALRRMVKGEKRIYTKELRLHPEDYSEEIELYRRAGKVWISYGVPFMIPILMGVFFALFIGDILVIIMKSLMGV